MIAVLILTAAGFVFNLLGRWLMVREDESLSRARRWLLMLVPGAELFYILTRWERARTGSVVCALSFAFAFPVVGKVSLIVEAGKGGEEKGFFAGGFQELLARETNRNAGREERLRLIEAKGAKLVELEAYLKAWYGMLEERRGSLCDEMPEETHAFNADAAAYHGLLTASKDELAELGRLRVAAN